jgi:hypothetical protein
MGKTVYGAENKKYLTISKLEVIASQSAEITCRADNLRGPKRKTMPLFITGKTQIRNPAPRN